MIFGPKIISTHPLFKETFMTIIFNIHYYDEYANYMLTEFGKELKKLEIQIKELIIKTKYRSKILKNWNSTSNSSPVEGLATALKKYSQMKIGTVEKIEGIELLRAIENNLNLGTFVIKGSAFAVDVNQDLMKAIDVMPKDPIRKLY